MDPHVQDWETVVIRKPVKKTINSKETYIPRPPSTIKTTYDKEGNEIEKLKTVSHEMAQLIIKTRNSKGMKQKDLATRASIDVNVLAEIERGGCVYDAGKINKIAKALGVTIPRK